ncbi:DUF1653 domain-containing protein [Rhodoferax sp. U11-2br]|uniref:DUF1653 domain-containing protein n=1 Tax=Rhodoferax sp. U11-2br TaxID=2838878 RepID=UPI001BE7C602|nr:DUF1653 domain-containing protein [Rhodoferax sp. U11-2br]MBT3068537.1 DUF1653 domain-containing protein [Rhodoferax sp. U11-2br]
MSSTQTLPQLSTAPDKGNARTEAALKRLRTAMADIEAEIDQHNGIYPFNHGRVTQSELCRRADVKKATLQNPLHKDSTRVEILNWLEALGARLILSRDSVRERVTAVADDLAAELQRLTLENQALRMRLAESERLIAQLRLLEVELMPPVALSSGQCQPGAQLRHYKGGLYTVVGSCLIEATLQPGVLYKPLQGDMQDTVWMRPLADMQEMVSTEHGTVPRFVLIVDAD